MLKNVLIQLTLLHKFLTKNIETLLIEVNTFSFWINNQWNRNIWNIIVTVKHLLQLFCLLQLFFTTACFFQALHIPTNKEPLTTIYGVNITVPKADPTIFTLYALTSLYYLDTIIYETRFLSSFEIQYEGFGYMSAVGYALYPFFLTSLVRYVYYNSIQLQLHTLIISGLTFVLGYYLYRRSNSLKNDFRKNPYQQSVARKSLICCFSSSNCCWCFFFADLETITTNLGKKLIVSGLWGIVRKPNYLGDILMHLALVPYVYNVPPVLFLIFTVALLVHRTIRDNAHCKQKYGGSWERYCLKVKYVLLPKVY